MVSEAAFCPEILGFGNGFCVVELCLTFQLAAVGGSLLPLAPVVDSLLPSSQRCGVLELMGTVDAIQSSLPTSQ